MKQINIQLQDSTPANENLPKLLGKLAMIGSAHATTETTWLTSGEEDGRYFNLNIECSDLGQVWPLLQPLVTSGLSQGIRMIVTCQGEDGWNDYLLLYHFDESELVDTL